MFRIFMVTCLLAPAYGIAGILPPNVTGTPTGSWAYFELLNAGHGQSITYFPTSRAEFSGAVFQGFVTYNHDGNSTFYGAGNDTIQVFSTYVWAEAQISIPIQVIGDDGHSVFVNSEFVGGGGFGAVVPFTLNLQANVPVLIELVGYNGPGNWVFGLSRQGDSALLEMIPGVKTSAVPPNLKFKPYMGKGEGQTIGQSVDPVTGAASFEGIVVGTFSHFGNCRIETKGWVDPSTGVIAGSFTQTTAEGSTFSGTFRGVPVDPEQTVFQGQWLIEGGTRKLADVNGYGTYTQTATGPSTSFMRFEGAIGY